MKKTLYARSKLTRLGYAYSPQGKTSKPSDFKMLIYRYLK